MYMKCTNNTMSPTCENSLAHTITIYIGVLAILTDNRMRSMSISKSRPGGACHLCVNFILSTASSTNCKPTRATVTTRTCRYLVCSRDYAKKNTFYSHCTQHCLQFHEHYAPSFTKGHVVVYVDDRGTGTWLGRLAARMHKLQLHEVSPLYARIGSVSIYLEENTVGLPCPLLHACTVCRITIHPRLAKFNRKVNQSRRAKRIMRLHTHIHTNTHHVRSLAKELFPSTLSGHHAV
jgi:hypothetical protein